MMKSKLTRAVSKFAFAALLAVIATGCAIPSWELEGAVELCKDKGGIYMIEPRIGLATFSCGNGERVRYGRPKRDGQP